jgi:hypothetical protein
VVSGSLSSPSRGAFHLSLTVLVHYRSRQFFSLGGWSPQLPTGFHVPRGTQDPHTVPLVVSYRTLTCSGAAFQQLRITIGPASVGPTTPTWPYGQIGLGYLPFRSPLLWESRLISFCRATEMFQFAHFPPLPLWIQGRVSRHHSGWVAPFGISRLIAWMQLPLNVSSVSTSFIGLTRLGIHLVLFLACGPFACPTPEGLRVFWLPLLLFSLLSAKLK